MAIKMHEINKMTKEQAQKKLTELHRTLLELESEGKPEKKRTVKRAIARVLTHLSILERPKKAS